MRSHERLTRVRNFIYSTPWAIRREALEALVEIFEKRLIDEDKSWMVEAAAKFHSVDSNPMREEYTVDNGIAVIRFVGPIMPRATAMNSSGATSLELQMKKVASAMANDKVSAIVLDFDTPGGSAMGLEEAALQIFNLRKQGKPIIGIANSMCCSAGYYLMSQCDEAYATPAAMVGSIGVRMVLESDDRQRKNDGIDVEYSYVSGPLKGGVGPLTEDQRAELTAMGETFFSNFKNSIERARPDMDVDAVATGQVWIGMEAKKAGLVDGITTLEELLSELAPETNSKASP